MNFNLIYAATLRIAICHVLVGRETKLCTRIIGIVQRQIFCNAELSIYFTAPRRIQRTLSNRGRTRSSAREGALLTQLLPLAPRPIAARDEMEVGNPSKRPQDNSQPRSAAIPRAKRSKASKACNACRKQKSRCERLSGDSEGCHRCGVIGIPCIFDSDGFTGDNSKTRKPRPILPRSRPADERSMSRE